MADSARYGVEETQPSQPSSGTHSLDGVKRGDIIGDRYSLTREIARGGMGVVFEAQHQLTGRTVALKFAPWDAAQRHLGHRRLLQEASILGSVRHAGIVEVFDAGTCAVVGPFIAMEMLEGRTLDGILTARRTLRCMEALQVAKNVGEALAHAHRRGIVHRDVKPSNIFVMKTPGGGEAIRLIDFGIAGRVDAPPNSDSANRITRAGDMLGTLDYLSPEQLAHADIVDPRADQYALATVMYECIAGYVPPICDRLAGPANMVDLRKLAEGVPDHVVTAIWKAMMPKPEDRFVDIDAFLKSLLRGEQALGVSILSGPSAGTSVTPAAKPLSGKPPAQEAPTRRRFERAPYTAPCRIVRNDGTHIDGRSEDISIGGLLVVVQGLQPTSLDPAKVALEKVKVRFALPTTGVVATVGGTIRWVKDGRGRAALGIEFDSLAPEIRASIATYVRLLGTDSPGAS